MSHRDTLPTEYFETKYRSDIDPWQFRTSAYEHDKYKATLGALTKSCYRSALEAGCSIGIFTALLAPRCERLIAIDGSQTAINKAKQQGLPNVKFETAFFPNEFPEDRFDLIVLSEVLYYFSEVDLKRLAAKCLNSLEPQGDVILCHWLGETDYPLTGYQASDLFVSAAATRRSKHVLLHESIYRLERLSFVL